MKWHLLLLFLFGAGFLPCLIATSFATAGDDTTVITTPHYFDSWCEEYCSSWETCNTVFGSNYVDLRLRVGYAIDDGPGRDLILDKYFGNTISRQSFETQFVLDVSSALPGFSPCHIHVTNVLPEGNDKYWDANSVIITFRLFPADATVVNTLTRLTQHSNSILYDGHVTRAIDPLYGLVAIPWDQSLKLMYSISVIGGNDVVDSSHGQYLNHGSRHLCLDASQSNSLYCVFEKYIVNDIEKALDLVPGQFIVLFIKEADKQSVIVSFRLVPQTAMNSTGQDIAWVQSKVMELVGQMADFQSILYSGNVTFKVDPTWGVSGQSKRVRKFTSKYLSRPARASTSDAYERCKATQRCPRALSRYDQSRAHSSHTLQTYQHGEHVNVSLFLDFEDWRRGIRGWEQSCRDEDTDICLPSSEINGVNPKPAGAHWSPFDFDALGPSVPTFGNRWNNGLVLNKKLMELNIKDQTNLVKEYESLVVWMDREFRYGVTDDAMLRSRRDIRDNIPNYTDTIEAANGVLSALAQSQCSNNVVCSLVFNTSDASLSGAVNATGVITNTSDGTEVALWAFDSIDIDEHVTVTVTGQRAMALLSRSSVHINTTLQASPGTLGGFPGGISVARHQRDRLVSVCNEGVDSRQFLDVCHGDVLVRELGKGINSNNVNGPGSPSTRVYLMTVQTNSPVVNEIQSITTSADQGQTLSGGFVLHFNGYSTPLLKHDITAGELKRLMEDSLNPSTQLREYDRTDSATTPSGIGTVAVTRESFGSSGGYQWNITFVSAVGDVGNDSTGVTTTNYLISKGARVEVKTIRHGNSIGGMFALQFLGYTTRLMKHDVSASELTDILLHDIPSLSTAEVLRSDPTDNCNDGHCDNGVGRSGGYTWTLTLTTSEGNVSPLSPTSRQFDEEGEVANMTSLNKLSGCVDDACPTINIDMGHSKSNILEMRSIDGTKPFSIAYGGAGAGYGGTGGVGFDASLPTGNAYGDDRISNLWAGSGGGVGIKQPFQLGVFNQPRFRGGSGGGAIEIVALNDIVLGSNSIILCDGESGSDGYMSAGGGGSGGAILLSAGGVVRVDGKLSVLGGAGGYKKSNLQNKFGGHGGGGSGGFVAVYGQSVMIRDTSTVHLNGGDCGVASKTAHNCSGMLGTLFVESALDTGLTIDDSIGAAGTRRSLFLSPRTTRPPLNPQKLLSRRQSTPEYDLGSSVRPSRVSFFFRVQPSKRGWDATFELRESRWSYLSSKSYLEYTSVLGIVIGHDLRHGVNYIGLPFDDEHIKQLQAIKTSIESNTWIKVDIRMNWAKHTHDVYVDDVRLVHDSPFRGEGIRALSLSNYYEGGNVWFDEIYVGDDTTMGFVCPTLSNDGKLHIDRPIERGWSLKEVGDATSLRPMQRHESHISRRAMYQRSDNKFVVPFIGEGEANFTSDVKFRSRDGDRVHKKGKFHPGSLLRLPRDESLKMDRKSDGSFFFGMHPDTFTWYGEHDYNVDPRKLSGAVMACSTQDFVTWKYEGAVLNFVNLTDMVSGSGSGPLRAEKPKVLYNNMTKQYVMWMIIDNGLRELGMAGVAVSDYHNGPFEFVRSLYPDGNQTHDQTLLQMEDGTAYLIRTYYQTMEYVLPKAVMQPTWESVKNADGSTNFALSYHRAEYEPGYDDYHDIYLQRWRTEDQPWKVICVNRLTLQEREVPYGEEHLNFDGEVCQDPFEYKKVLGQGHPHYNNSKNGIQSRFLDPNDPSNNVWIPNSVPSVKGQSWKANYDEGACGKDRKVNDDMHHFDPNLPNRELPNRRNCSNIVDNPIHPTLPDKRMGPQDVVERRRAKYIAVSRLTDDYLDTSGIITTMEGELEGADLLSLVLEYDNEHSDIFQWLAKELVDNDGDDGDGAINSTFQPQLHDPLFAQSLNGDLEHHEYEMQYNDRSRYSPATVFDDKLINVE